jgi:hypothetical protein
VKTVRLRAKTLLLLGLAAGLTWIAAPALSMHRYMPAAVDFEQKLPHASARKSPKGGVRYRSPVVAAPERFDLVGLTRELRPLEIRARDEAGEWSRWVETEDGGPIYFGGADELQVRTKGWRPEGTLHYVNVSGTTSELGGLLTSARQTINSAFISIGGTVSPAAADAATPRPPIVTRAEWGANDGKGGCPPRVKPSYGRVKAAAVHHTVTANNYSEAEAPSIVLGICRYHRNGNGWNDIGYNALVDRFGNVYQGRAGGLKRAVVGAHAQGFNAQTSGTAMIGTHTSVGIAPAERRALVNYLAWKLSVHRITATGKTTMRSAGGEASRYPAGRRVRTNKIIGHGTIGLTACPGEGLEAQIPKIRRLVQQRLEETGGTEPPPDDDGGGVVPGIIPPSYTAR